MPREITDGEGITWTCIQAFAGLGNDPEKADAARVEGSEAKWTSDCCAPFKRPSLKPSRPPEFISHFDCAGLIGSISRHAVS